MVEKKIVGDDMKKLDDENWKKAFGNILKMVMTLYSLDYSDLCEKYTISTATFRYWQLGKRLPQEQYMKNIKDYIDSYAVVEQEKTQLLYNYISEFLSAQGAENVFFFMKRNYPAGNEFAGEILTYIRNVSKHKIPIELHFDNMVESLGKTQAVVFDFDGTLTKDKVNKTTWERIWVALGYTEYDCQKLHKRYNQKEISHEEWCKITENIFREARLHKEVVEAIASEIKLIKGVRKTLKKLSSEGIKIYIVSGSIDTIIKKVIGNMSQYVESIKANCFRYDKKGFLTEIVGTKYDFEGKAFFISQIAEELHISPKDILFVGNSVNDRFAYLSGARTLCINPSLTDPTNRDIWHDYIQKCDDLELIMSYL